MSRYEYFEVEHVEVWEDEELTPEQEKAIRREVLNEEFRHQMMMATLFPVLLVLAVLGWWLFAR